jgi:hypothetical protein
MATMGCGQAISYPMIPMVFVDARNIVFARSKVNVTIVTIF